MIQDENHENLKYSIELRRNFANYPFLNAASSDETNDISKSVQKLLLNNGFELQEDSSDFGVQEWLKNYVNSFEDSVVLKATQDE